MPSKIDLAIALLANGTAPTALSVRDTVLAVRADMNRVLIERSTAIDNALLALLTGEHYVQFGPTGTGKSFLVRALAYRLTGCQYFEKTLHEFAVPDELFGPVDLLALQDSRQYVRVSTGSVTEAHIVFLDEIGKSNGAIRDTLLTLMQERLVQEVGFAPRSAPLLSLFSASNETFHDKSAAFDDRFLLREVVEDLSNDGLRQLILSPPDIQDVRATLSLTDLEQAQAETRQVKGTLEVAEALLTLRDALSQDGVRVSPRKWGWCGPLLKARAWLDGQAVLDVEHLTCLVHALWTDPKERSTVERHVYQVACPLHLKAVEIEDAMLELFKGLPPEDDANFDSIAASVLQQLTDAHKLLSTEMRTSVARTQDRALSALAKIAGMHEHVRKVLFKNVDRLKL